MTAPDWKTFPAEIQEKLYQNIPEEWRDKTLKDKMLAEGFINAKEFIDTLVPDSEKKITSLDAPTLAKVIASRELTSYEVAKAFFHRAALAQQLTNCVIESWYPAALAKAKELDKILEETGKVVGPLHGVPISLKDQVDIAGFDSSIGYIGTYNHPKSENALLATILENAGAVTYVKTTVPMAMMAPETVSNIHGYTSNSLNINLTSGGSSGGEGSLIGAQGSPLGVGTDIGGSIRIPSAFQGLYGLRPSHGRVPYLRVTNSYSGQDTMPSVIGPLSPSLEGIELFMQTVVGAEPWRQDHKVVPIPWRDASEFKTRKLTIGVMAYDGCIMPNPPVLRAVDECVAALKRAGHEVIEWKFEEQAEFSDVGGKIFAADLGQEIRDTCAISGEPVVPVVEYLVDESTFPEILNVNQWWDLCNKKYELQTKFLAAWAESASKTASGREIDAIICPVWATPPFEKNKFESAVLGYSVPFNVVDSSVVIVPVTKVDKLIDLKDETYTPKNAKDQQVYDSYNPEVYHGIPICVQVACKRLEEEKAIAIASVLADSLK
ncbi:unnamed protein product [Kuraishia capsulata CBS 1993]|uniref:amidase n=1 Tax=Kuraishia capsulata CBS 1993 TaxID=1382522 RepID=W6MRT5_9ASCO|nr:uncharacterized protein KUCA_T00005417001 [Kuraishia capsulata CBS 1993]CDK29429.1 unnamed protein product [Kuraishia capsulata CBS 1993]